jgi:hypothetical protein
MGSLEGSRVGSIRVAGFFRGGVGERSKFDDAACYARGGSWTRGARAISRATSRVALVCSASVGLFAACESGGSPPRNQADTRSGRAELSSSVEGLGEQAGAVGAHSQEAIEGTRPEHGVSGGPDTRVVQVAPGAEYDRSCRTDADCALVPDDCTTCPPCEPTWRQAASRATVERLIVEQKKATCPPIACLQCSPLPAAPGEPPAPRGYIGTAAVCVGGQCSVR